jgi:hypothetical protein
LLSCDTSDGKFPRPNHQKLVVDADISGGDAYEMAIPDVRADGELLNERHNLFFVDYLRLAFTHGGFPVFEGRMPPELEMLSAGLLTF